MVSKYVRG